MIRRFALVPALALTLQLGAFLDASADTISDSDFASWSITSVTTPPHAQSVPSTGSGSVVPDGGDSGTSPHDPYVENLIVTHTDRPQHPASNYRNPDAVYITNVKTDYTYGGTPTSPALTNATFTLTLNAKPDSSTDVLHEQYFGLLMKQGDSIWAIGAPGSSLANVTGQTTWQLETSNTTSFSDTSTLISGSGGTTGLPDLSGQTATEFGFFTYIGGGSFVSNWGVEWDNWSLTSNAPLSQFAGSQSDPAGVPEIDPGSAASAVALLGCGIVMWGGRRNRKRPASGI
jgi:hypothetical protein